MRPCQIAAGFLSISRAPVIKLLCAHDLHLAGLRIVIDRRTGGDSGNLPNVFFLNQLVQVRRIAIFLRLEQRDRRFQRGYVNRAFSRFFLPC